MLILGEKEVDTDTVGVRARKEGDIGQMNFDEFVNKIQEEIDSKKI